MLLCCVTHMVRKEAVQKVYRLASKSNACANSLHLLFLVTKVFTPEQTPLHDLTLVYTAYLRCYFPQRKLFCTYP